MHLEIVDEGETLVKRSHLVNPFTFQVDEGDLEMGITPHLRKHRAYKRARKDYEKKGYDDATAREYAKSCGRQAAARLSTGEDVC